MTPVKPVVIYWDASAILSALVQDKHSEEAQKWAAQEGVHLISTLSYSEVLSVLARMRRERVMAKVLIKANRDFKSLLSTRLDPFTSIANLTFSQNKIDLHA